MAGVALLSISAGVASLAAGSALGYDPTTWEIWARELVRGALRTGGGGPAWKPLPVFYDALLTWLGGPVAVAAWLVAARAAVVAAVLTAWAVGRRLGGVAGGIGAALVTAGVLIGRFGALVAGASSEPMCAAAFLVAVWAALRSSWRVVVGALLVAALLRPEAWPFLVVAVATAAWREPSRTRSAAYAAAALLVVPLAWFVPDWSSTGDPLRSLHRDTLPTVGGPLHAAQPAVAVLREAARSLPDAAWRAAAVALLIALIARQRRGVLVAVAGAGWIAVEAVAAQLHASSGDTRYLLPGLVVLATLAGAAPGMVARWLAGLLAGRTGRAATAVAAVASIAIVAATMIPRQDGLVLRRAWHWQARQSAALRALRPLAGVRALPADGCPHLMTGDLQVPAVAWATGRPLQEVGPPRATDGLVVAEDGARTPIPRGFTVVARAGPPGTGWTWWAGPRCRHGLTRAAALPGARRVHARRPGTPPP